MPYVVTKDTAACPRPSKPWAVQKQGTSETFGCHPTKEAASAQQRALYANEVKSADTAEVPMETLEPEGHRPLARNTIEWRKERAEALSTAQRKRPDARPSTAPLELRDENSEGIRTLRSYASLFNTPYIVNSPGYRFEESIRPGAFRRNLGTNPDVVFRTEHKGPPLAATWNDSLRLGEDERGFWYEADLKTRDPDVRALLPKIEDRTYRESSFAFRAVDDEWSEDMSKRAVKECVIDRGDVSVVTYGASRATAEHMTLRSEEVLEALQSIGFERFLEAWTEWRNYTLLSFEERAGKVLSSDSLLTLQKVLALVSNADDGVDEAQILLSDLMGVPNPDSDESETGEGGSPSSSEQLGRLRAVEEDSESRRDFSAKQRQSAAKSGAAMPDGSFPIQNVADLRNAIQAVGRASNPAAAKAHIKKRAAALGATNLLPEDWRSEPAVRLVQDDSEDLRLDIQLRRLRGQL